MVPKIIFRDVNRAGLVEILGLSRGVNVQGEEVKKLNDYSNDVIVKAMSNSEAVCVVTSEEVSKGIPLRKGCKGIYPMDLTPWTVPRILMSTLTAALFSPSIKEIFGRLALPTNLFGLLAPDCRLCTNKPLVYTAGYDVHGFTFDPDMGEVFLLHLEYILKNRELNCVYCMRLLHWHLLSSIAVGAPVLAPTLSWGEAVCKIIDI